MTSPASNFDFDNNNKSNISCHKRTIVHFDIDCFYAQVEMIRNPSLRGKPLGIQQKYILVTCNYEARKRGVTKLMLISDALKKCPDLIIVNGEDLTHYRSMSYQISDYIQKYTQQVERLGFDENYADVSGMVEDRIRKGCYEHKFSGKIYDDLIVKGNPKGEMVDDDDTSDASSVCSCGCMLRIQIGSQIAADIRAGLNHELGITSCAGIAHNKLLAKLVGSIHKPNQQTSVLPHQCFQLVSSLPGIRSIPGIGSSSAKRLKTRGIDSIWDLQQAPISLLEDEFGKSVAETFSNLCFGNDDSSVVPFTLPQTISDEDSFKCCNKLDDAKHRMNQLIVYLLKRLQEDARMPSTLRLTVRGKDYVRNSRQCPIPASIFKGFKKEMESLEETSSRLMPLVISLFHKLVDVSQSFHLTLINICFAKFIKQSSNQNTLDSFFVTRESHTIVSKLNHRFKGSVASTQDESDFIDDKPNDEKYKDRDKINNLDESEFQTIGEDGFHHDDNLTIHKQESVEIKDERHSSDSFFSTNHPNPLQQFSYSKIEPTLTHDNTTMQSAKEDKNMGSEMVTTECNAPKLEINDSQSLYNLKKLLPKDIDASGVLALPNDIQEEVLSSYGIKVKISRNGEKSYVVINKVLTRSQRLSDDCDTETNLSLEQNSELSNFHSHRKSLFSSKKRESKRENKILEVSTVVPGKRQKFSGEDFLVQNDASDNREVFMEKEQIRRFTNSICGTNDDSLTCSLLKEDSDLVDPNTNVKSLSNDLSKTAKKSIEHATDTNDPGMFFSKKLLFSAKEQEIYDCKATTQSSPSIHKNINESSSVTDYQQDNTTDELNSKDNLCTVPKTALPQHSLSNKSYFTSLSASQHVCSPPEPKRSKCPRGIDPAVFYSLPSNIQGEILAHNAMGTGSLFTNGSRQNIPNNSNSCDSRITASRRSVTCISNSNKKGVKAQRDISDYFKKK